MRITAKLAELVAVTREAAAIEPRPGEPFDLVRSLRRDVLTIAGENLFDAMRVRLAA